MIAVTGGSGFIGARLVEHLARDRQMPVVALVNRLGTVGAARVAALPNVRLVQADIRDTAAMTKAIAGCEIVVHTALAPTSAPEVQEQVTVAGTRAILDAARVNSVRRIVHVSTAAVHAWDQPGTFTEDAPVNGRDFYSRTKLAAEQTMLQQTQVPVTVLRPTCVYGPFSRTWTVTPIEFLRFGIPLVAADNAPRANLIYVDNLVDLIVAAADVRDTAHHTYLATDDAPHEWSTLFAAYARTIGVPLYTYPPASSSWSLLREEIAVSLANAGVVTKRFAADVKRPVVEYLAALHRNVPIVQRARRYVPSGLQGRLLAARAKSMTAVASRPGAAAATAPVAPALRPFASRMIRDQYGAKAVFSNARAKRELGWSPRIGGAEAVERTCAWIAFAGL